MELYLVIVEPVFLIVGLYGRWFGYFISIYIYIYIYRSIFGEFYVMENSVYKLNLYMCTFLLYFLSNIAKN